VLEPQPFIESVLRKGKCGFGKGKKIRWHNLGYKSLLGKGREYKVQAQQPVNTTHDIYQLLFIQS
jgi:hypothetical protein